MRDDFASISASANFRSKQFFKKTWVQEILFLLFLWIILEGISGVSLLFLGLQGVVFPWTFILILENGFILPVMVAAVMVAGILLLLWGFYQGGIYRALSYYISCATLLALALFECGLIGFSSWEGLDNTFYPLANSVWRYCESYRYRLAQRQVDVQTLSI